MFFSKKLFIPFDSLDKNVGGPNTFMGNLRKGIDKSGFKYITKINHFNKPSGIFFPIFYNIEILKMLKAENKPIIQRLDGIYYPSKHGNDYNNLNEKITDIYKNYSDIIIFQTEYCRKQCYEILGTPATKEEYIINNGADISIFYPRRKIFDKNNVILTTTGNFQYIDKIEPIIKACDLIDFKFTLNVIGPVKDTLKAYLNRSYIKYVKQLTLKEISDCLRQTDIFIYSHLNSPCSNSIIEAISCGIPIVSFKTGSIEELCDFNKELLADVSDDIIQKYEDLDYQKLKEKILECVEHYLLFKERSLTNSKKYPLNMMIREYIKIFKDIC